MRRAQAFLMKSSALPYLLQRSLTLLCAHAVHEREVSKKSDAKLIPCLFTFFQQCWQQHTCFNYDHGTINGVTSFMQLEDLVKKIILHWI